jgi:hypothetical protein
MECAFVGAPVSEDVQARRGGPIGHDPRWKAKRDVIGVWLADGEFRRNFPRWSWFWTNVLRNIILMNERRMLWMYGEKGRFQRQMRQWARLNDYFGDMVIDESFFDLDSDGPVGLGSPAAARDYGAPLVWIPRASPRS